MYDYALINYFRLHCWTVQQGGQIFPDPKKPFAKICILEEDISIFWHKRPKTPDF